MFEIIKTGFSILRQRRNYLCLHIIPYVGLLVSLSASGGYDYKSAHFAHRLCEKRNAYVQEHNYPR